MKRISYFIFIFVFLFGAGYHPVFAEEMVTEHNETAEVENADEEDEEDGANEEEKEETEDDDGGELIEEEAENRIIVISAVNAGMNEFIELRKLQEELLALSGLSIVYFNSKNNTTVLYTFDENDIFTGENIIFRLAKTELAEQSDFQYSGSGMSKDAGKVSLIVDDEEIDTVCWGKHPDCDGIKSIGEHTLVRNFETMEFSYQDEYEPGWEEGREVIEKIDNEENADGDGESESGKEEDEDSKETEAELDEPEKKSPVCAGLELSELFTYFVNDKTEQFIEIHNPTKEEIILDGCSLRYKNKSYVLDGVVQAEEYFVIFPDSLGFSLTKNPTKSNLIELIDTDGSIVDTLEYFNGQKKGVSYAWFGFLEDAKENWEFTRVLTPREKNKKEDGKIDRKNEDEVSEPVCKGIQFSEILSFYETEKNEQFIEFYNPTAAPISLNGCNLKYKNKYYSLYGMVLPEGYLVYFPTGFTLTKNPTNSNKLELVDADGSIVDTLEYFNGQKKGVSYAWFGFKEDGGQLWEQTYAPTPGEENNYQKYKSCPDGKVINEETGNCVRTVSLSTSLKACPEGWYRNPLTNRCKKYATTTKSTLKECPEGYERNPTTNRCRKVVKNDGAKYEVAEEKFEEKSTFLASTTIIIIGSAGVIYIIFEYRKEIAGVFRKKAK